MRAVRTRALLIAGPVALVLAGAAACGSTASTSAGAASTATVTTSTSAAGGSTSAMASSAALEVTANKSLGQIVTTGTGMTVYRYDADSAKPSKSNCTGGCASAWPPVLVTGSAMPQVTGVSSSLVGEVTRSDGSKQLTLDGWPLYTYAGDSSAGATSGQGSGGVWWAVTPTGAKASSSGAMASSSASSSAASGSGGSGW
jgi:predicted lipoprotein with Yx(FWY)xxD motif